MRPSIHRPGTSSHAPPTWASLMRWSTSDAPQSLIAPMPRARLMACAFSDLSRLVAGNVLTPRAFADLGANVVNRTSQGNTLRAGRRTAFRLNEKPYTRNKRSIRPRFKKDVDRATFEGLGHRACAGGKFQPRSPRSTRLSGEASARTAAEPRDRAHQRMGAGRALPDKPIGTTVEAASGLAHKSGFPDSPPLLPISAGRQCRGTSRRRRCADSDPARRKNR